MIEGNTTVGDSLHEEQEEEEEEEEEEGEGNSFQKPKTLLTIQQGRERDGNFGSTKYDGDEDFTFWKEMRMRR